MDRLQAGARCFPSRRAGPAQRGCGAPSAATASCSASVDLRSGGGLEVRSYQCCEGIAHLTETEFQVAAQLFAGASYKEASKALGLCPSTVTKHVNNLYPKLGIGHRTELGMFFPG